MRCLPFYVLRRHLSARRRRDFFTGGLDMGNEFVPYVGVLIFLIPIRLAMFAYQRIYRFEGAFSYIAEFIKIFKSIALGSLLIITFTFLFRGGFAFRDFSYSRGVFAAGFRAGACRFFNFPSRLALSANKNQKPRHQSDSDFNRRHKRRSRANNPRITRTTRSRLPRRWRHQNR